RSLFGDPMRYLIVLALLCCGSAWAQCSVELSWTPPTAYTNGDPLDPATDLLGYRIYDSDGDLLASPAAGTQSYALGDLPYGDYTFTATAVATNGQESAMSNAASWSCVDNRVPEAPTNFFARLL